MADQGENYEKSWILHHILDRMIGCRQIVDIRRKMQLIDDLQNSNDATVIAYNTGGQMEGFEMEGSDVDKMFVDRLVRVLCSNQDADIPIDNRDRAIAIMRKADCRPCYVTLELIQMERSGSHMTRESLVRVRDRVFISSEIYAKLHQEILSARLLINTETHGPSSCLKKEFSHFGRDADFVLSYGCTCWPPEANEWLSRSRQHGWPSNALIYNISQSGCHVVPVGDKTSDDSQLQWRISFVTAERKLIHSLDHEQFLVYGLLKYFLKQISGMLKSIIGDEDILSSYIMKTVIFSAVEGTPKSFWREQNTFHCFRLCLKILIAWVNAGYCPNYFIVSNNMFKGKLHSGNQEKLIRFLIKMYDMKWMCLHVGTFLQPSIGVRIERVMNGAWKDILFSPEVLEYTYDMIIFRDIFSCISVKYSRPLPLLSKSQSDLDEFIAYCSTVKCLSYVGMEKFGEEQAAIGNKQKYKSLRKSKTLMTPFASASTSPGLLMLATYYFQTGNYMKALLACGTMISSFKVFVDNVSKTDQDKYQDLYCGRGYTLLHKCQKVIVSYVLLHKYYLSFCPSQLRQELTKCHGALTIPPLPYALFLSFLCYHELGERRRRDTALIQLRAVKYNEQQGNSEHWIVNNLLGICYELVGDTQRAIREYKESLIANKVDQQFNPAREKIARLQHSQGEPCENWH